MNPSRPSRRASLSLCMIVRDEAAWLPQCLASVQGLVQEIVIVDTGSVDGTPELARQWGARVISCAWRDDFAYARNISIDAALCDYILVLDADERLTPEGAVQLQAWLDAPLPGLALHLALIESLDAQGRPLGASHMARFFRRDPQLRYQGAIHEELGRGLKAELRFDDRFRILHFGYDPALARERGKHERNLRLLESELALRPNDPTLRFYRGQERYALGDDAAALEDFRAVLSGEIPNFSLSAALLAVECLRALNRPEEALTLGLPVLQSAPRYAELAHACGWAALETHQPELALPLFESARHPTEGLAATAFREPSVQRVGAARGLTLTLALLGRGDEAWAAATQAQAGAPEVERPELALEAACALTEVSPSQPFWDALALGAPLDPERAAGALFTALSTLIGQGHVQEAFDQASGLLSQCPPLEQRWPIHHWLAELALALGHAERHRHHLETAAARGCDQPEPLLALATLYLNEQRLPAARALIERAKSLKTALS